jgi:hypothetical protein
MENFLTFINENLRKLGKIKVRDTLNSHRFKSRGLDRKRLTQVPDSHRVQKTNMVPAGLTNMIKGMDVSGRTVDIAKNAPMGVWKLSKKEVLDIARKYKFIIPNKEKPMKHLGSTGIQMIRYKPGMFYLFKPHHGLHKYKKRSPFSKSHSKIIKGIQGR